MKICTGQHQEKSWKLISLKGVYSWKIIVNDKIWCQIIYPAIPRWDPHYKFFFWNQILSFTMFCFAKNRFQAYQLTRLFLTRFNAHFWKICILEKSIESGNLPFKVSKKIQLEPSPWSFTPICLTCKEKAKALEYSINL